jgi:hypothetical protein
MVQARVAGISEELMRLEERAVTSTAEQPRWFRHSDTWTRWCMSCMG